MEGQYFQDYFVQRHVFQRDAVCNGGQIEEDQQRGRNGEEAGGFPHAERELCVRD